MAFTFSALLLLIFSGIPIVFAFGAAAAIALAITTDIPMAVVAQRLFTGLDSFPLMAIPFFIMVGLLMEKGGIARRLVDVATALVGWIVGSLYLVAIVAGTGLAAISGSGSADTAAIGSMLSPQMRKRGYDLDMAAAVFATAGALAPIVPPSIFMIIAALAGNISVGALFLAGIVPGLMIAFGFCVMVWRFAKKRGEVYRETEPFSLPRLGKSLVEAIPAMLLPGIIIGGIVGGVFTPTEASCIAVFVGIVVSCFIYRELRLQDVVGLVLRAASLSAAVLVITGVANVLSWLITNQGVPALLAGWLTALTDSPIVFLLLVNILLLIVGTALEENSSILILMPILMPIAVSYGIDPVHFGLIVVLNLSIGVISPPYGICLFMAAMVTGRSVAQVCTQIWRPIVVMTIVLLLVTYMPWLALALPKAVMGF
jgi:C4-dicarboxylate transporter DctM subunit